MTKGVGKLESWIEEKVWHYAEEEYGIESRKFKSPNYRSVPDRIFYFPNGLAIFIEFKRQTCEPSPGQWREINRLIGFGFLVFVVDTRRSGEILIDALVRRYGSFR